MKNTLNKCARCKVLKQCNANAKYYLKNGECRYSYLCLDCNAERARKYRTTGKGKDVYREIMRKQYEKHKEKCIARQKVNYRVRRGKMVRPDQCSICKQNKKVEAHHSDYSKPLDVKWLCRQCHFMVE
jgi:hypothetical protein